MKKNFARCELSISYLIIELKARLRSCGRQTKKVFRVSRKTNYSLFIGIKQHGFCFCSLARRFLAHDSLCVWRTFEPRCLRRKAKTLSKRSFWIFERPVIISEMIERPNRKQWIKSRVKRVNPEFFLRVLICPKWRVHLRRELRHLFCRSIFKFHRQIPKRTRSFWADLAISTTDVLEILNFGPLWLGQTLKVGPVMCFIGPPCRIMVFGGPVCLDW